MIRGFHGARPRPSRFADLEVWPGCLTSYCLLRRGIAAWPALDMSGSLNDVSQLRDYNSSEDSFAPQHLPRGSPITDASRVALAKPDSPIANHSVGSTQLTSRWFYAARIVNRRRHHRPPAGADRPSVHDHQRRNRRHQRRIHDQRRARHRPHVREGKQYLHLGRIF